MIIALHPGLPELSSVTVQSRDRFGSDLLLLPLWIGRQNFRSFWAELANNRPVLYEILPTLYLHGTPRALRLWGRTAEVQFGGLSPTG